MEGWAAGSGLDQILRMLTPVWWVDFSERHWPESGAPGPVPTIEDVDRALDGSDIDMKDLEGNTGLLSFVFRKWEAGAIHLLKKGANPNLRNSSGTCALHLAVSMGPSMVKALLEAKAELNFQDTDPEKLEDYKSRCFEEREQHRTALHYAVSAGNSEVAEALVQARADLNIIDCQYKTPLHLAIERAPTLVDLLLRNGADPNLGNMEVGLSTTCLMMAAHRGDEELAAALIRARAHLDATGRQGVTALHLAARGRHAGVARLLLEARCDTSLQSAGKTAGEVAARNGLSELALELGVAVEPQPLPLASAGGGACGLASLTPDQRRELFID